MSRNAKFIAALRSTALIFIGISIACATLLSGQVFAATPVTGLPANAITLSPSSTNLTLSSGLVEARVPFTLTNRTGQNLYASIATKDFQSLDVVGSATLGDTSDLNSKYGLSKWMTLPAGNNIALPNGQATTVLLNIENRSDLAPGGHYGAVIFTINTAANNDANQKIVFKQELVSLVFVNKLGGEQYGLKLQTFDVNDTSGIPNTATMTFASTGNVQVVPRGYITVADPRGKVVAKGLINPQSTLILPGTSRQVITQLLPIASSKLPGRYTVTAYYRYEQQNQFQTQVIHTYRWITSITVYVLVLTGLIVSLTLFMIQRYKRTPAPKA